MDRITEYIDEMPMVKFKFYEECEVFGTENGFNRLISVLTTKLAEYEDLEEKLDGIPMEQFIEIFVKHVENSSNEEYGNARILTNKETEKWQRWLELEKQGLLK